MNAADSTYTIRADRLPAFDQKMSQIRRRATKLEVEAPTVRVGPEYDVYFTRDWEGRPLRLTDAQVAEYHAKMLPVFSVSYVDVEVSGNPAKLAGWTLVATLQHLEAEGEAMNLLRISPHYGGGQLPERFRTDSPENCDHCHQRRRRNETFVVKSESGEWKQVGRDCLQDFLGGADPRRALALLEMTLTLVSFFDGEEGGWGGGDPTAVSIETFLAQVAACVRVDGYLSRRKARETIPPMNATADDVLTLTLYPPKSPSDAQVKWARERIVTRADCDLAAKALAHARSDSLSDRASRAADDFLYNLFVAAKQDAVTAKLAGIAAYLIPFYQREIEREVLRSAERESLAGSKYIGAVKDRPILQVRILSVRPVGQDSEFGTSLLHKALTSDGDVVVWFDRSDRDALEVGSEQWIKGTVKAHKEFDGVKQTTLNRVDLLTAELALVYRADAEKKAARAAKKAQRIAAVA